MQAIREKDSSNNKQAIFLKENLNLLNVKIEQRLIWRAKKEYRKHLSKVVGIGKRRILNYSIC